MIETKKLLLKLKKCFSLIILFWLWQYGVSQSRNFARSIDSGISVLPNQYLINENYSWLEEELVPHSIDQEALNASVFEAINSSRKKLGRTELQYDPNLDKIALHYIYGLKYRRFSNSASTLKKMNRYIYSISRRVGIKDGLVVCITDVPYLVNFDSKRSYFYNSQDSDTDLHLFYGHKGMLKDSSATLEPIPLFTYQEFSQELVKDLIKGRSGKKIRAKAYQKMTCWLLPIEKTIAGKRVPRAKLIVIFSGKRMGSIVGL